MKTREQLERENEDLRRMVERLKVQLTMALEALAGWQKAESERNPQSEGRAA